MTPHTIELAGLSKRYGSFTALENVSLSYEGPRAIGYLGPNGAGKTTTLKILTTLAHPSRGRASIDGVDVDLHPRDAMACVGAVVETPEPYGTFTVQDAIEMAGEFRGLTRGQVGERIAEFQKTLDLPPLSKRIGTLSKGLRQRVVLAGALVADPPVIILDEPTSGLDPAERVRIRNVILELKRDHLILMSSHLLGEVTETCDDVVFLNHGKVLMQGSVADIQARSRTQSVEVCFLDPVSRPQFTALGPLASSVSPVSDRRFRLSCDGSEAGRAALLDALRGIGRVTEFYPLGSALEDTYLRLMGEEDVAGVPTQRGSTA